MDIGLLIYWSMFSGLWSIDLANDEIFDGKIKEALPGSWEAMEATAQVVVSLAPIAVLLTFIRAFT